MARGAREQQRGGHRVVVTGWPHLLRHTLPPLSHNLRRAWHGGGLWQRRGHGVGNLGRGFAAATREGPPGGKSDARAWHRGRTDNGGGGYARGGGSNVRPHRLHQNPAAGAPLMAAAVAARVARLPSPTT